MTPSGFVLLDKNPGETSFKALFPLKRVFSTKRVGHAGTLDLRASGLIVAAIGRATRLLPFVEAKDKCYTFRLHLGYETDTLEWDGDVVVQGEFGIRNSEFGIDEGVILREQGDRRIQGECSLRSNRADIGKTFEVLVEGPSKKNPDELCGRAPSGKMCVWPDSAHRPGDYVFVKVKDCTSATLLCEAQQD